MHSEDDFRNLVVGRGADGYLVRLGEVAQVQLAAENQRGGSAVDGGTGTDDAGHAAVHGQRAGSGHAVKKEIALIRETLPEDIALEVNIDNSVFIRESMKKVVHALGETGLIVLVVIFLFLGSLRATLIPAATIPVSIFAAAHRDGDAGLLDQHADAAGRGAGHRPRGGRRHRGAGEHRAAHRARRAAAAGRHPRQHARSASR